MNNIDETMVDDIVDQIMNESDGIVQVEEAQPEEIPVPKLEEPKARFEPNPLPVEVYTSRFSSAEWFEKAQTTSAGVVGLGGIGSWVSLLLARLNLYGVHLYDFDTVDGVNMSGQFYCTRQIGMDKVSALWTSVRDYSANMGIWAHKRRIEEVDIVPSIMFCGFDNMKARKIAFEKWYNHIGDMQLKEHSLFIDGRLAAEEFQVFCMTGADEYLIEKYRKEYLFDDEEAEATVCSYKQTSFCANMIASVMINLFVNYITNLCDPVIPRELPFITTYNASLMTFNKTY